ncbi:MULTISPECIES: site-specific integrase [unclassified Leptolyngbya]|uniref:site-specific integrase n=1 Tax=unclassified Leptolyngbya TaxID=2650499 RepID=UPI0016826097|nr:MULTISPECIES: site-specific integrase [unclassified Leptolyngbya]MBD1914144.1 site-specific integrase [Leptolyngbya sp. FACHB-8]MBD2155906.1 site-specific integrase [Leptolyngbya sp. FACHB-16]
MTDFEAIDNRIAQTNQRLKAARLGLKIERRGQQLALRGTLPPRPGSHRLNPHQQRIPLELPATPTGLKEAEQTAKVIAAQLIQKTFEWRTYLPVAGGGRLYQMELPQKIAALREHLLRQSQEAHELASAKTTWSKAYAPYMRKLEAIAQERPNLQLAEAIVLTVQQTRPNTRSRQICCTALKALADFLEIELPEDFKDHWGSYGTSRTQLRHLPSDADILAAYERIPNPAWRFVYGLMATYGLRNHEVFFCDFSALERGDRSPVIEVLETTKTGEHQVWPFPPDWVEQFNLWEVTLPSLKTDLTETTLQRIGQQVSLQFQRYGLPFAPYDLRHAWAVRTIHLGIPDTVAARMMGHSVAIHNRTYHRWIGRRDQQQAVEAALARRSQSL